MERHIRGAFFAPEGIYRLVAQFSDGSEADTAILVGQIAPFLTSISALESTEDGEVRLSFYASENGRLTLGLWGASWSLLENIDISAGTNEVTVDATRPFAGHRRNQPDADGQHRLLLERGACGSESGILRHPADGDPDCRAIPHADGIPHADAVPHADAIPYADGSSDAIPHAVALAHADPEHHLHTVLRQPV